MHHSAAISLAVRNQSTATSVSKFLFHSSNKQEQIAPIEIVDVEGEDAVEVHNIGDAHAIHEMKKDAHVVHKMEGAHAIHEIEKDAPEIHETTTIDSQERDAPLVRAMCI